VKPVARSVERGKEKAEEVELDNLRGREEDSVLIARFEEKEEGKRGERGLIVDRARRRVGEK